jgi:hypothetical protein
MDADSLGQPLWDRSEAPHAQTHSYSFQTLVPITSKHLPHTLIDSKPKWCIHMQAQPDTAVAKFSDHFIEKYAYWSYTMLDVQEKDQIYFYLCGWF